MSSTSIIDEDLIRPGSDGVNVSSSLQSSSDDVSVEDGAPAAGSHSWLYASVATLWLTVLTFALFAPALLHGSYLGPYDITQSFGLGSVANVSVQNPMDMDQIRQSVPWVVFNWTQIHSGHLPLWNPYSGLGLPQLSDFLSSVLSLPMLVAYLLPLRFAFDTFLIVKFIIAGTGVLFLCRRVLGLDWMSATFAASVAELSGSFTGWAGWAMTGVICWYGWVLGAAILIIRGHHRFRWTLLLAIAVAFAIYGGHPESCLIMAVAAGVPLIFVVVARVRNKGWRPALKNIACLVAGIGAGGALAAPMLLPGSQLLPNSVDAGRAPYSALPWWNSVDLALSGYNGTPATHYVGSVNYYETAGYVGVIGLILAVLAVSVRWRQPLVRGLGIAAVVLFGIIYISPVAHLLGDLPVARVVAWTRSLIPMDLLLGVLAGIGLNVLLTSSHTKSVRRRFGLITALAAGWIAYMAFRNAAVQRTTFTLFTRGIRSPGIKWAGCEVAVALLAALAFARADRWFGPGSSWHVRRTPGAIRRIAISGVAITEILFLLFGTPNIVDSSTTGFVVTPAIKTLQAESSGLRVGFGPCENLKSVPDLGILDEANVAYQVSELIAYEPSLPLSYFASHPGLSEQAVTQSLGQWCPAMTDATVARHYGVSLILDYPDTPKPPGTISDGTLGGEEVFKVPGSGIVTIEPQGAPADSAQARRVTTSGADPTTVQFVTDAGSASTVYLHIGNFSGWTATIDGKPLALRTWATIQMAATVPPGRHVIVLHYEPRGFQAGVVLAVMAILAFGLIGGFGLYRRRRLAR